MTEHVRRMKRAGAEPVIRALSAAFGTAPPAREDLWSTRASGSGGSGPPSSWGGRELRAVATPGHTQGHTVFADLEQNLLFAGDHVLPRITPSVGFEAVMGELPLGDYLRSLRLSWTCRTCGCCPRTAR